MMLKSAFTNRKGTPYFYNSTPKSEKTVPNGWVRQENVKQKASFL